MTRTGRSDRLPAMPKRARPKKRRTRKTRRQRAAVELKPLRKELDALVRDGKATEAVEV